MRTKRFHEIAQLYHAAMDLPEGERASFLDRCEDDDIRREVASLLANEDMAQSFLEDSAFKVASKIKPEEQPSLLGRELSSYLIISEIGRGGMGVVYGAKDQKLGRDVAIKVLSEEFAQDKDRAARFQREAKLLASLNHPNIASIHGLEVSDGTHFIILELVEGETLADQISKGPIPVEEALNLALQIAEALEAAHEKGVIHRDLKPTNIKVTPEGKIKVLDFGLAKAFAGDHEEVILSNSPTLSDVATQQGMILGTAAYMSPEQAKGKAVDKRTDIWAFGAVLYEILVGQAAFQGEDFTEILASVVKANVNLNLLPANAHWRVREIITRCLQKDQKDRYRDIGDVQYEIKQILANPKGALVQSVSTEEPQARMRTLPLWIAVTAILSIIISGLGVWKLKPTEPIQVISFDYYPPEGQELNLLEGPGHFFAVSPDGSQFAYSTTNGIYIRSMNELDARLIPFTDKTVLSPFFSPDGQWVGYFSKFDSKLKKISIRGGAPVTLCDIAGAVMGAIWYADNTIIYADETSGIMRVSANGGTPETLVEEPFLRPQLLSDGKSVIYTDTSDQGWRIVVQSLESGKRKELLEGMIGQYLPTGHLIWVMEGSLYAVAFDPETLEVSGGHVPVVEGVMGYAVSDSGTLAYFRLATNDFKNILMPQDTATEMPRPHKITIVMNWFEELKELVPIP